MLIIFYLRPLKNAISPSFPRIPYRARVRESRNQLKILDSRLPDCFVITFLVITFQVTRSVQAERDTACAL